MLIPGLPFQMRPDLRPCIQMQMRAEACSEVMRSSSDGQDHAWSIGCNVEKEGRKVGGTC